MATEWYVSSSAGGGGVGTEGDPWTLAQAFTAINDDTVAWGDKVWVKADGTYTTDSINLPTTGAGAYNARHFTGYSSTTGDGGVATIERSGGANIFVTINAYWIVKNFKFDAKSIGTYGMTGFGLVKNVEVMGAVTLGIYNMTGGINLWSHDNGGNGFQSGQYSHCISQDNGGGFQGCATIFCVGKGNTNFNFEIRGPLCINCVSDGGSGHGFLIYFNNKIYNAIVINSPVGKQGVYFASATVNRGANILSNINFYSNDSNSNKIAFIDNVTTLDPQFTNTANKDYTRTGDNLNRLGFSEVGVESFDYELPIGIHSMTEELPHKDNVIKDISCDFGRVIGTVTQASGDVTTENMTHGVSGDQITGNVVIPSGDNIRLGSTAGANGNVAGDIFIPSSGDTLLVNEGIGSKSTEIIGNRTDASVGDVRDGKFFGPNGTGFEGTLATGGVFNVPLTLEVSTGAIVLETSAEDIAITLEIQ